MVSKLDKARVNFINIWIFLLIFSHLVYSFWYSAESVVYNIRGFAGMTIHLPCQLPSSTPFQANAVWVKETVNGTRTLLGVSDDSSGADPHVELLYPGDQDQTLIVRNLVNEDAGIYRCDSAAGHKLSTVQVRVEGRSGGCQYQAS